MFNEFGGLKENFDIDEGFSAELDEGLYSENSSSTTQEDDFLNDLETEEIDWDSLPKSDEFDLFEVPSHDVTISSPESKEYPYHDTELPGELIDLPNSNEVNIPIESKGRGR